MVVTIQSAGVFVLNSAGAINLQAVNSAWLATVLGAFIFGFGIVIAGGCATGTYYRSGEGLVGSWTALATYALFTAVSKTGSLVQTTESLRAMTVPLTNISTLLGVSPWVLVALLVNGVTFAVRHHLRKPKLNIASLPAQRSGLASVFFDKHWGAFSTATVIGVIANIALLLR